MWLNLIDFIIGEPGPSSDKKHLVVSVWMVDSIVAEPGPVCVIGQYCYIQVTYDWVDSIVGERSPIQLRWYYIN